MRNKVLYALSAIMLMFVGGISQTQASLVYTFSDLSSDTTPASDLDATLSFAVTSLGASSGNDLLTLTLDNQTTVPNAFTINEVYFNYNGAHGGFSLETGTATLNHGPINADGFGNFDIKLDDFLLASGATAIWTIDLGVTGVVDSDFNDLSTIPPGETRAFAALKFVQGPGDDSAFGAVVVPIPGAAWLFGSGLFGLVGIARRKRT